MSIKFSQFNAVSSISSSGYIVGYDGANNVRIKTSTADRLFAFTGGSLQFVQLSNAMVPTNTIGLDKLVNVSGTSLIGNPSATTQAAQEITASVDDEVLMRSGGSLVFSKIGTDNINNSAVTYAKIQDVVPQKVLGRGVGIPGPAQELTLNEILDWLSTSPWVVPIRDGSSWTVIGASNAGDILRYASGALGFGKITYTSLDLTASQRVIGRTSAGAGAAQELTVAQVLEWLSSTQNTIAFRNGSAWTALTASSNGNVLRMTGGALGFGQIATAGIEDTAVTYAKIQNVTATSRVLGRKTSGAGVIEELTASELLDFISNTQGSILYRGASGWAALGPGTTDYFLQTKGAGADPVWAAGGGGGGGIGGSTGATDNSVLRADGTGGATLQNSDITIDDATTSTQANVTIANTHSGQTNSALVLSPKGTGAFILGPKPNGASSGGNARGPSAIDLQITRSAATQVAAAISSSILGGVNNTIGANASRCVIVAGDGNSITGGSVGSEHFIGAGKSNSITSLTDQAAIIAGQNNTAVGQRSLIGAGQANKTNSAYSSILNGQYGLTNLIGQEAFANGRLVAGELGCVQRSIVNAFRAITGTSAANLTLDGTAPSSTSRIILSTTDTTKNNRIWTFRIALVAACTTTGGSINANDVYGATYEGVIKRIGTSTSIVGTVQTVNSWSDGGFAGNIPTVAITADDTNEALDIQWTTNGGNASTVVRVMTSIHLTELGC